VSDALGTATEMRAMKNYAGHRLSPWLGHLMVSRSETARALLTPGEIMQLPPDDEIVMVAGVQPIRSKKARYYQDKRMTARLQPPPKAKPGAKQPRSDDWSGLPLIEAPVVVLPVEKAEPAPKESKKKTQKGAKGQAQDDDAANADIRREPMIEPHVDIAPALPPVPANEFDPDEADPATHTARIHRAFQDQALNARRASLDPDDGLEI
jgi:type IV secretion system protein VirD4